MLDGVDALSPQPDGVRVAARMCVTAGLAGAVASAATGLVDWQYTHDNARRLGAVHGLLNTVILACYTLSWSERRKGRQQRAVVVSGLGYLVLTASTYLGGALVYRHRIGVDHADDHLEPRHFVAALPMSDLRAGVPRLVEIGDVRVVLVREDGTGDDVHAFAEGCPHLGAPLSEGWLYEGTLVCPWHGSRFDLLSGDAIRGPATSPLPCLETRVREGTVEVRRRPVVPQAAPGSVVATEQRIGDAAH